MRRVALAFITSLGLLIAGCGGGGGGGGGPVADAAVGGLWYGTTVISGQGTYQLLGMVAEDGTAFFFQEDGRMYWGTIHSSGNDISAQVTGAGLFGVPLWDGSASGTGSITGTISPRRSISATSVFTTILGSGSTGRISLAYDASYDDDSSLQSIAGNYVDALGLFAGVLNVASNGTVFLQDPSTGCVVNGQVSIIDPAYNAYRIDLAYSSCTGVNATLNGATFTGLAAYDAASAEAVAFVQGTVAGTPTPNVFIFDRV
jgi:hypothetical protein